jgi:hypothetical protein
MLSRPALEAIAAALRRRGSALYQEAEPLERLAEQQEDRTP